MNRKYIVGLALISLIMISAVNAEVQTLRIKGSNTLFPIIESASLEWEDQYPDVTIEAAGPGSGAGMKLLLDGQTDIAPMSRAPKDSEIQAGVDKGMDIKSETVGLDALIIIVNKDNPVNDLTHDQIAGIFNGTIRKWSSIDPTVNLVKDEIKVIERDTNSGTHDYFNEFFLGEGSVPADKLGENYAQYASTSQLFENVASEVNAIGYGGLAYLDDTVKAVNVDGKTPSVETAKTGEYPVARPLYLVYDDKTLIDIGRTFIDYILSPEGQRLVLDVGYVNVKEAADPSASGANTSEDLASFPLFYSIIGIAGAITIFRKKRVNATNI